MGFHKSSERGAAEDNQFLVEVLDYSSPPELLGRRGEEDDYVTLHPSITNQLWVPDIFVDQAVRDAVYKMCSFFCGRVAECHGYGGYICVKKLEGWGKKSGRAHSFAKSSIVWGKFEQLL